MKGASPGFNHAARRYGRIDTSALFRESIIFFFTSIFSGMELHVFKYPHPILKQKAKPIKKIDAALRDLVVRMFALMYETEGVGLAANQVGLPLQLCVINPTGDKAKPEEEVVLINPVIRRRKGSAEESEGCLSFPEIHASVVRPDAIEIEAISLNGEVRSFAWKGFLARVAQHELDHLHGVGFIDRLTPTVLLSIKEELEALEIEFESNRRLGFLPSEEEMLKQWDQAEINAWVGASSRT